MSSIRIKDLTIGEGTPKIAVSITGRTKEEIFNIIGKIDRRKVDLVEWRADFFGDILNIKKVLELLKLIREELIDMPIIFTFRTKKEGGERKIPIDYYIYLNKTVAQTKLVDIIDIEIFSLYEDGKQLIEIIHKNDIFVIGSNHDFLKTPSKSHMLSRLKSMENMGADILKLAFMAREPEDVLRLLNISNKMKKQTKKPLVTISMGKLGTISRISGAIFGSSITFGALDKVSAPGQVNVDKLFDILFKLQ